MVDPPSSVAHVLDIMDDEAAVRYESRLAIDFKEFARKSVPLFGVMWRTEDVVVDRSEDGEVEGGVAGRMG